MAGTARLYYRACYNNSRVHYPIVRCPSLRADLTVSPQYVPRAGKESAMRRLIPLAAMLLMLGACGGPEATPSPLPTVTPAATSTPAATATPADLSTADL